MIVTCPACAARYRVADSEFLGVSGRDVRCANCGYSWYQTVGASENHSSVEPRLPVPDSEPAIEPLPISASAAVPRERTRAGSRAAAWLAVLGAVIIAGFATAIVTHRSPAPNPTAATADPPSATGAPLSGGR